MSESVWKKEISFKRKPKPAAHAAAPVEQAPPAPAAGPAAQGGSVWKKEIGFKRKPKPAAQAAAPVEQAPPAPAAGPTAQGGSVWKKEIGFKRKPKATAPVPAPAPAPVPVLPVAAEPALAAEPVAEQSEFPWLEKKERWWNKEIGGSRKRERPPAQPAVFEAAAEPGPAPVFPPEPVVEADVAELVHDAVHAPAFPAQDLDPAIQGLYEAVVRQPVEEWGAPPAVPPAPIEPSAPIESQAVAEVEPAEVEAAPAPAPVERAAAAEADLPFWKKEISLKRKPKPAAQAPAEQAEAEADADAAPEPKQKARRKPSSSKRSFPSLPSLRSLPLLPRLELPSFGKGGSSVERLVGLKVGGSQIAAARINNNGVAELVQLARMPLERGIVVGGELRDPEALGGALKSFFAEHKLPRRGVRLGVASSRIGVRIFEISGIQDDRQFVNAVRFRAQEALPIPLDEAAIDYRILSEGVNAEGEPVRRVLLVVAHKDLVERYVEACRIAGIQLAGIDLEAFALLRSLAPPTDRTGSALVAVAIGHERTTLAVSDGRVCEFTRVLEWGGWAINVALGRALDARPEEVEGIKRGLSLNGDPAAGGLAPEQAEAAVDAVRRSIESLARDLVSSLQYYQGQPGSLGIGEVMLTGGTAHLVGLAEELERLLGVNVRVGDPLRRLKVSGPVAENDLGSLAIAIGLGIED